MSTLRSALALFLATAAHGCGGEVESPEAEALALTRDSALGGETLGGGTVADDPTPSYRLRGLAGKCVQAATGGRLALATCSGADAQKVKVLEGVERLVELRIGELCLGPVWGWAVDGMALELAACNGAPYQRWMLDGDSVRIAATPAGRALPAGTLSEMVLAVGDRSGREGSPITLARTRRDESDYWDFLPNAAAAPSPTSGFQTVRTAPELIAALERATPGAVVEMARGTTLDLSDRCRVRVGPRVTLRVAGDRSGRRAPSPAARLFAHYSGTGDPRYVSCKGPYSEATLISLDGAGARVTGLQIEGPSTSTGTEIFAIGTQILTRGEPGGPERAASVDHCDLFGWQTGAVNLWAPRTAPIEQCAAPIAAAPVGVVQRNYIHANRKDGTGYGVSLGGDARALVLQNTFIGNRHALTASGDAGQTFHAHGNLVLFSSPKDGASYQQDFDMHGTAGGGRGRDGVGGETVWIQNNTFLGNNRTAFQLRGPPCKEARFTDNVTRQPKDALLGHNRAVYVDTDGNENFPVNLIEERNRYSAADPTRELGAGDFDGDGRDDLFLATGAAFYVSFAGKTTWRFRAAATESLGELRFGDFDGDRRTDVLRSVTSPDGTRRLEVKWGGEGEWASFARIAAATADLLVGDFNGDGTDDLLHLSGTAWTLHLTNGSGGSWSGTNPLYTRRARDARVGHFDGDAYSDVLLDTGTDWIIVPGGAPTRSVRLGPSRGGLGQVRIADVDGDGRSDAVRTTYTVTASQYTSSLTTRTEISYGGTSAWTNARTDARNVITGSDPDGMLRPAPLGRFDAAPGADLLFWRSDRRLDVLSKAVGARALHSNDDGVTKNEMY